MTVAGAERGASLPRLTADLRPSGETTYKSKNAMISPISSRSPLNSETKVSSREAATLAARAAVVAAV